MRIRDYLSKKRRIVYMVAFICWLSFGITGLTESLREKPGFPPLFLLPFIGFGCCVLFMLFGFRCPRCKNNLGYTIQWPSSFWNLSDKLKYCPFCGVEFDKEIEHLHINN